MKCKISPCCQCLSQNAVHLSTITLNGTVEASRTYCDMLGFRCSQSTGPKPGQDGLQWFLCYYSIQCFKGCPSTSKNVILWVTNVIYPTVHRMGQTTFFFVLSLCSPVSLTLFFVALFAVLALPWLSPTRWSSHDHYFGVLSRRKIFSI